MTWRNHSTARWPSALALTLALALLLSGCGDDGAAEPPDGTNPTQAPAQTSEPEVVETAPSAEWQEGRELEPDWSPDEQVVVDVYHAYWESYLGSIEEPVDRTGDAIRPFATDTLLASVIPNISMMADAGHAIRPAEPSLHSNYVIDVILEGDSGRLFGCVVDDGVVYETSTGQAIDDDVFTKTYEALLVRVEGTWRVDQIVEQGRTDGATTCVPAES